MTPRIDVTKYPDAVKAMYGLSAWQETPFYTPRERAALEWAETLTLIGSHHVPDELYTRTREHFTEAELVGLTLAVIAGFESGDGVRAALAHAGAQGADRLFTAIGGPNPVLASLLESGFVIPEQDIYMATSPDITDPLRHHPHPGFG